jgi:ribosomal protein S18 acetylase RimI-like enzyme
MVSPARRRHGLFTRLLDAAWAETVTRGTPEVLLIVDRGCPPGVAFAKARGGSIRHSEYRMSQETAPPLDPEMRTVELRPADPSDYEFLIDCLARAFGRGFLDESTDELSEATRDRLQHHTVITEAGVPVGTMIVDKLDKTAGIYGFAVPPELQGKGIGRAALTKVCNDLRAEGIDSVHLEVLVDNPRALHLYESCGFVTEGVEDYYLVGG